MRGNREARSPRSRSEASTGPPALRLPGASRPPGCVRPSLPRPPPRDWRHRRSRSARPVTEVLVPTALHVSPCSTVFFVLDAGGSRALEDHTITLLDTDLWPSSAPCGGKGAFGRGTPSGKRVYRRSNRRL